MNLQENLNRIKGLMNISEQTQIPLLTVLSSPAKIGFSTDDGKIVKLNLRDDKGVVVPGSTYPYKVSGKYGLVGFNAKFRNIRREADGDLFLEALPTGWVAQKLLGLVPNKNKTQDGWVKVYIDNRTLTNALNELRAEGGKTATIDAGTIDVVIEKL